jgi:hypothetical protein
MIISGSADVNRVGAERCPGRPGDRRATQAQDAFHRRRPTCEGQEASLKESAKSDTTLVGDLEASDGRLDKGHATA